MRLALRDLFWLALLAAGATFWWGEHRQALEERRQSRVHSRYFWTGQQDGPSNRERVRIAAVERFSQLTNEELADRCAALTAGTQQRFAVDFEPCLLEMAQRGRCEALQSHYDQWMALWRLRRKSPWNLPHNLALLTALRRSQQQPDPLRIDVAVVEASSAAESKAPLVRVTHTNVDSGDQLFDHRLGGKMLDRNGHWNLVLKDERGDQYAQLIASASAGDVSNLIGGAMGLPGMLDLMRGVNTATGASARAKARKAQEQANPAAGQPAKRGWGGLLPPGWTGR